MTFATASESELAELRSALEPVYAELMAAPETRSAIDAITDLKAEVAASTEAPARTSTEPPATASPIPDGTYETTWTKADWQMTKADWLKAEVSEEEAAVPGVYTMIFAAGEWTLLGPNGDGEKGATPSSATKSRPISPRTTRSPPAGRSTARRSRSQTSTAAEAMRRARPWSGRRIPGVKTD